MFSVSWRFSPSVPPQGAPARPRRGGLRDVESRLLCSNAPSRSDPGRDGAGRGRDGQRRSPRTWRTRACGSCCSTSSRRSAHAEHHRHARNRFAAGGLEAARKAKPAAFLSPRSRAGDASATSTTTSPSRRRVRPRHRGDHREARRSSGALREARAARRPTRSSRRTRRACASPTCWRAAATTSASASCHALLQPAALHEAARARRRRRHDPPRRSRAPRRCAAGCSARASSAARTRRTSSRNRIGAYAMMRTIHDASSRAHARGRRRDHRPGRWATRRAPRSAPPTSSASTRSCTSPSNCYDTLTDDEERDVFELPDVLEQDGREASGSATRPRAASTRRSGRRDPAARSEDARVPPAEEAALESIGATSGVDDVDETRAACVGAATTRRRRSRGRCCSRRSPTRRAASGEIADDVVDIDRAMRWGYDWELGPVRDLGRARRRGDRRADGGGRPSPSPPGSKSRWPPGRRRASTGATAPASGRSWDDARRAARAVPTDPRADRARRRARAAAARSSATTAPSCWTSATACSASSSTRKTNTIDADVIEMTHEGGRARRAGLRRAGHRQRRRLLRRRQPLRGGDGARARGAWDEIDAHGERSFQDATQRTEVRARAGGRGAVRHDARRRRRARAWAATRCRRRPRPTSASSRSASASSPAAAAR